MGLGVFAKIGNWAGGILSPASAQSYAAPVMPDVRVTGRKFTSNFFNQNVVLNAVYVSPWYDTNVSGTQCIVFQQNGVGSAANGFLVQETNDIGSVTNANFTVANQSTTNAVGTLIYVVIHARYWRLTFTAGATGAASFTATEYSTTPNFQQFNNGTIGLPSLVQGNSGSIGADAQIAVSFNSLSGVVGSLCAQQFVSTGVASGAGTNNVAVRTPNIYRSALVNAAGQTPIWTPQTSKKFRLMKYVVEAGEDVSISGGPTSVNVAFTQTLPSNVATGTTIAGLNLPQISHRFTAPASVLTTSGELYSSKLMDIGNGSLATAASYPLAAGLMVAQSTSAVNPAWTIASNQWEAATVGFKTSGNFGNFQLVQSATVVGVASVASIALPATAFTKGNSIFVFIRYSKVVGGAATITVTDTAGNAYTVSAQTANATDGANGSAIAVAYCINVPASSSLSANTITVNYGTNNAAASAVLMLEYSGLGSGGIDAALVGTSGNTTTPASGNYTPATAGDLLFSFFGTSATIAALPTVGSNFRVINGTFAATSGCLGVADNFGNGALTTGAVNVIAMGTEE